MTTWQWALTKDRARVEGLDAQFGLKKPGFVAPSFRLFLLIDQKESHSPGLLGAADLAFNHYL
jgi:hypothetical protein